MKRLSTTTYMSIMIYPSVNIIDSVTRDFYIRLPIFSDDTTWCFDDEIVWSDE